MKKYVYSDVIDSKEKFLAWQQIYKDYHSGDAVLVERAICDAVAEMEPIISSLIYKRITCYGRDFHKSGARDIEDLEQSMREIVIKLLDLYTPIFEGHETLGSSYITSVLKGCISDYFRDGDGSGNAPLRKYIFKKYGPVSVNSLEEITENPDTTFVLPNVKSTEDVFMEKYHQKIYDDFMRFISGYSSEEKKKAALLFARIRLTADEYEYFVRMINNAEKRYNEKRHSKKRYSEERHGEERA